MDEHERRQFLAAFPPKDMQERVRLAREHQRLFASTLALRERLLPTISLIPPELLRIQRQWKEMSIQLSPVFAELNRSATMFAQTFAPALESFRKSAELFKPIFEEFYRREAEARRIEGAGLLPHWTTPFEELEDPELADEEVAHILKRHYVEGWPAVRAAFAERVAEYDIDDDAKAAFIEALDSHGAGHFRSTVAFLFNEIERVVRHELYGGTPGGIASLPKLHDLAGDMYPTDIKPNGAAGMRLFRRLVDHLYVQVKTDEDVARMKADPVPNRHAATHGLVIYNSRQNSLNTIIMTDYVFQVITLAKARR